MYLAAAAVAAPVWLPRMVARGKHRTDWRGRLGRIEPLPRPGRPRLLLHAVSVGEVNAIRLLVRRLSQRPGPPEVVVSVTTDTGIGHARRVIPEATAVVRYPFDLSGAVRRFLDAVAPTAVGLVELELWPNFSRACARRGIPIGVVNGRLSARSFSRYRRVASLVRPSFERLRFAAVQTQEYAQRFAALGASRVVVTGNMKWDSVRLAPDAASVERLARELGIDRRRPLVVAGSTAPGEPELLQAAVPRDVQLLCAPRRPEWFEAAARAMPGCARRSAGVAGSPTGRFLLDTIGELRHAYALADVVVVGRSFGRLHGSDMMEPVGLGKPTVVGPAVADFQDTVTALLETGGILQVTPEGLAETVVELIQSPRRRQALLAGAEEAIRRHEGATDRNADLLLGLL